MTNTRAMPDGPRSRPSDEAAKTEPAARGLNMTDLTQAQKDELERLTQEATPGPWTVRTMHPNTLGPAWVDAENVQCLADCGNPSGRTIHGFCGYIEPEQREANAAFIAAARVAVPALLEENKRLREALRKRIEAGHNDTCDHMLSEFYDCSCGDDEARKALGEVSDGR